LWFLKYALPKGSRNPRNARGQGREVAKKARKLGVPFDKLRASLGDFPGAARHTCPGVPSGGQVCVRKSSQPQKASESAILSNGTIW
jgi:hypothetical protein